MSLRILGAALVLCIGARCGAFTLLQYNCSGNGVTDWSTNSAQVRAIGRQVAYLSPDIVTFNEIPALRTHEMTNFVQAYLPGFFLATNSASDGYIRSVIVSRFPVERSQSWLARSSLAEFGYAGTFTRDLFEAQVQLPGAREPLHVFVAHLKCCTDTVSLSRRAAEARAISNFFATIFLPANPSHVYTLSGDLNEDVDRPPGGSGRPIQILTSLPTGLRLTTPRNPFSGQELTWSIRSPPLSIRFDYILPCGLLFSNLATAWIFRSDLTPGLPPPLQANDAAVASDHLPTLIQFNYPDPPLVLSAALINNSLRLTWPTLRGRAYEIQRSEDFLTWTNLVTNLSPLASPATFTTDTAGAHAMFQVRQLP